jgi:hypothetical protein
LEGAFFSQDIFSSFETIFILVEVYILSGFVVLTIGGNSLKLWIGVIGRVEGDKRREDMRVINLPLPLRNIRWGLDSGGY